jgi:hypothetical protein
MDEMRQRQPNSALGEVSMRLLQLLCLVLLAAVIFAPMAVMGASSCPPGHCACCTAAIAQTNHCAQSMPPFRTCTCMIQDNVATGLVMTEPSSKSQTATRRLFSAVAFVALVPSHRISRSPAEGVYSSLSVLPPLPKQIGVLRI